MNVAGWRVSPISGALVGSLYAINAWDLPTFLLLVAVGAWIGAGASLSRAWKLEAGASPRCVRRRGVVAVPGDLRAAHLRRRARAADPHREITGRLQPDRGRRPAPGRAHVGRSSTSPSSACPMPSASPSSLIGAARGDHPEPVSSRGTEGSRPMEQQAASSRGTCTRDSRQNPTSTHDTSRKPCS